MVKRGKTKIIVETYSNLITSIKEAQINGVVPIIAEVKRLTPKLVVEEGIRKDSRDAGDLARLFQRGGAIGISLVAEKEHFGGQPEIDIPKILASVDLPLLVKDFITDEATVDYYAGLVSAVGAKMLSRVSLLLIAHHLGDNLQRLIDYVYRQGMLVQVEIRGEEDLNFLKYLRSMPQLIGLNNKRIDVFEKGEDRVVVNKHSVDVFREVIGDALLISSSAHHSPQDVRISIEAGADAVLAGTTFMQANDTVQEVKDFVNAVGKRKSMSKAGHFGKFGGRYAPEMLIPALEELEKTYLEAKKDKNFQQEFKGLLKTYCGRPTPLTFAKNLTEKLRGVKIYLKNEGLNPTGSHKITHCIGQALLAKRMGKKRLIAETGAGQHGVATATVAAMFGFSCTVYMGEVDIYRQRPNVFLMEQLGAEVIPVKFGQKTLKDAVNAALKDYIENVNITHYVLGSVVGPHPFPTINRDFQSIVGKEIRKQIRKLEGRLPDYIIACVGGGSNAMGAFTDFVNEPSVRLIGVEAGGKGRKIGEHATRFPSGSVGVVEGYKSYFLQDSDANIQQLKDMAEPHNLYLRRGRLK